MKYGPICYNIMLQDGCCCYKLDLVQASMCFNNSKYAYIQVHIKICFNNSAS